MTGGAEGEPEEPAPETTPPAPRAFGVGYERQSGDMLVYGGYTLAGIGILAMLINGGAGFLVLTAAGLVSAAYFSPLVDRKRPQLGASSQGLYLERLGVIAWPAIADISLRRTAVRSMDLAVLEVTLERPLAQALVIEEAVPFWKRPLAKNWRLADRRIEVRLHNLTLPPEEILARIERFFEVT